MSAISGIEGLYPTFKSVKFTKIAIVIETIICLNIMKKELKKIKLNLYQST